MFDFDRPTSADRFDHEADFPPWCDIERDWWNHETEEEAEAREREYEAQNLGFDSADDMDDCFQHSPCDNAEDYYKWLDCANMDRNAECEPDYAYGAV